jgi:hypothetical protein
MAIWYILWPFGIHILWPFGIFYGNLVYFRYHVFSPDDFSQKQLFPKMGKTTFPQTTFTQKVVWGIVVWGKVVCWGTGVVPYFVAIGYILWTLGIFYGHWVYFKAIWCIFWLFGILFLFWYTAPRKIWQSSLIRDLFCFQKTPASCT